jgi:hypothetical protein
MLVAPTDKTGIKTEIIPGLKPTTDTVKRTDAEKGVTLPLPPQMKTMPGTKAPPPVTKTPAPVAAKKG